MTVKQRKIIRCAIKIPQRQSTSAALKNIQQLLSSKGLNDEL